MNALVANGADALEPCRYLQEGGWIGSEASAEVLVGPPGRMVSNAGQQQWY
jgi:hypothetical protein